MQTKRFPAVIGLSLGALLVASCADLIGLNRFHDALCSPGEKRTCAYHGPSGTEGVGICKAATQTCAEDGSSWSTCDGEVTPNKDGEICANSLDDDCDGVADNGCPCKPGEASACYDGPAGTEGVGICHGGTHVCNPDGKGFAMCMNQQLPAAEDYSTAGDEDCDGVSSADTTWVDTFGAPAGTGEMIYGVAANAAGEVFVVGSFGGSITIGATPLTTMALDTDVFVAKLSAAGVPMWAKQFGGGGLTQGNAIAVTGNGDVVFTGRSAKPIDFGAAGGPVPTGLFVVALDSDGNTLWSGGCNSTSSSIPTSIGIDATGNITIGGNFSGTLSCGSSVLTTNANSSVPGMFVAQFAADGSPRWSKKFDGAPNTSPENLAALAVEPGGSIWLTGTMQGTVNFGGASFTDPPGGSGPGNAFLVKLDANGAHLQSSAFGDGARQGGTAITVDAQGNAFVTGYNEGTMNFGVGDVVAVGTRDVFVAKFDQTGFNVWSAEHGSPQGRSSGLTLGIEPTGDIVVGGTTSERIDLGGGQFLSDNATYAFLARYDEAGAFVWSKYYGGNKVSFDALVMPYAMTLSSTKDIVLGGYFYQAADFGLGTVMPSGQSVNAFVMQVAP